jgi:hypothetical protein
MVIRGYREQYAQAEAQMRMAGKLMSTMSQTVQGRGSPSIELAFADTYPYVPQRGRKSLAAMTYPVFPRFEPS